MTRPTVSSTTRPAVARTTTVIVAGGPPLDGPVRRLPVDVHAVIAVDSGLDNARAMGLTPTTLVGDLDSISPDGLAWANEHAVEQHQHPADKDQTDLELALDLALTNGVASDGIGPAVHVIDSGRGRLDQAFANLALLAAPRYREARITAQVGDAYVTVIHDRGEVRGEVGSIVSLLAVGGPAAGVSTTGLRWPLIDAVLEPGSTWGVSNEFVDPEARVAISTGVVLAIQP